MVHPIDCFDTWGTRVGTECLELFQENFSAGLGDCMELLLGRRSQENCEARLVQSDTQLFQDGIERLGALFVCLG